MTTILNGDCLDVLKTLPDESIHMVCTSPPYWNLRSYLPTDHPDKHKEIGTEKTPEEYVEKLVAVFQEVRKVLRSDGVCWVNLGSTYAANRGYQIPDNKHCDVGNNEGMSVPNGFKPKDLIPIPWMVAMALQKDGWYLRQDIIWAKPNPMPESVTDRCTKAHEYVFLLSKSARYWYDAEAIKEASVDPDGSEKRYAAPFWENGKHQTGGYSADGAKHTAGMKQFDGTRNRRSVWTVATQNYSGSHFATFPEKLIEPMILAGCPAQCCPACGKGWEREKERTDEPDTSAKGSTFDGGKTGARDGGDRTQPGPRFKTSTLGHRPACACPPADSIPGVVLDPFGGSGTTGQVASRLGRKAILIELNPEYLPLVNQRTAQAGLNL